MSVDCFRPLIRGFFFYMTSLSWSMRIPSMFPSPHSGILFLFRDFHLTKSRNRNLSFRPLIRGFFFYSRGKRKKEAYRCSSFRPLIRGFFFYGKRNEIFKPYPCCFRPLIRGFFFYAYNSRRDISNITRFRPLIRGFFFYLEICKEDGSAFMEVSVPSFGDSFFILSL